MGSISLPFFAATWLLPQNSEYPFSCIALLKKDKFHCKNAKNAKVFSGSFQNFAPFASLQLAFQ
jgi:hypothetical protein